jgi:hypothetical protein
MPLKAFKSLVISKEKSSARASSGSERPGAKHVELRAECCMTGNISTEKLAIADGCSFKGEVRMLQKGNKPVRFTEKRKESKKT